MISSIFAGDSSAVCSALRPSLFDRFQGGELRLVLGVCGFSSVGAGHAGCEAAMAAARMGLKTALYTINLDLIAQVSCGACLAGVVCHRCPHL